MMKKLIVMLMVLSFVCVASADIRFMGNGSYETLATDDGAGGWTGPGWQSATVPGAADIIQLNWGNNTVTLDYAAPTITMFKIGVGEEGTLHILDGGTFSADRGKIGNNNATTGHMIIDAGGTLTTANWTNVAGADSVTGDLDVYGTANIGGHLWAATGAGSTATIDIWDGGVINNGGANQILGLGTGNAVTASGGVATLNVNDGGLLILNNIHGEGTSIMAGSMLNLFGSGRIEMAGNFLGHFNNVYAPAGTISGDGIAGNIIATFDGTTTTVSVVPEPATMMLLGLGGMLLRRKK